MNRYDDIVIGGGHNGLIAAAYLARGGRNVLLVEKNERVGGATYSEEILPGFTVTVFSYVVSLLRPQIIDDLDLARHGLQLQALDGTFTPLPDGRALTRWHDPGEDARIAPPVLPPGRRQLPALRPPDAPPRPGESGSCSR